MSEMPDSTLDALTKGPEGIHHHDGFTMAVGPEAVGLVRLVAIRSALDFECRTGMRMSRVSALKAANQVLGTTYRSKAKALDHLTEVLRQARGEEVES